MNGKEIKRLLEDKEMKQRDLATATGLSEATISNIINGKRAGNTKMLKSICKALGAKPEQIW